MFGRRSKPAPTAEGKTQDEPNPKSGRDAKKPPKRTEVRSVNGNLYLARHRPKPGPEAEEKLKKLLTKHDLEHPSLGTVLRKAIGSDRGARKTTSSNNSRKDHETEEDMSDLAKVMERESLYDDLAELEKGPKSGKTKDDPAPFRRHRERDEDSNVPIKPGEIFSKPKKAKN